MSEASRCVIGSLHPVMTPRVQRIRQQISFQELELRLAKLGFSSDHDFNDYRGMKAS